MTRTIIGYSLIGALIALAYAGPSAAQIVKCKSTSGQITYTQNTCPTGTAPLELSENIAAESGRTPSRSSPLGQLSARATALKQSSDACIRPSSAACAEYLKMQGFCGNRENCGIRAIARRFAKSWRTSLRQPGKSVRRSVKRDEDRCGAGDQGRVARAACNPSMLFDGTAEDLKKCARSRNFATGRTWAQFESGGKSYVDRIEGEGLSIACFERVEFRTLSGR